MDNDTNLELSYFNKTGFFGERELALKHLREADEILTSEGVDYCLMFGTLLGLLRHGDFIPWDDDIDIIIFDTEKFQERCKKKFEEKGYVVLKDIRRFSLIPLLPFFKMKMDCGYRIYSEQGRSIPGVSWKFPWLGVWRPVLKNKAMTLPPEKFVYNYDDFFPLQRKAFLGFSVWIPNSAEKVLSDYFGTNDWMEYCLPSALDHRYYKPTGFPDIKLPIKDVLSYLEDRG